MVNATFDLGQKNQRFFFVSWKIDQSTRWRGQNKTCRKMAPKNSNASVHRWVDKFYVLHTYLTRGKNARNETNDYDDDEIEMK